ncbi:sulfotransferase 1B1-like [Argopecten irradians]|uniref:sulfotransferase 1B1-like n=1 Tax=Argopecten irradians TaxID=31199 RepID=UPI00371F26CB
MPYDILPSGIKRGIGKVVYVIRNPKDVFVSCKFFLQSFTPNVYNGDMDGFLKIFLSDELGGFGTGGSWSTHTKEWDDGITSNPNLQVHIIKYEELKKDTYGEIEKLAKFLDVKYSKELLGNIVKEVAFDKMKAVHKTESGVTEKWTHICKDGRLPVYRKGIVGDWKNHLTVKQNELFDAVIEEKLSGRNIELIYE